MALYICYSKTGQKFFLCGELGPHCSDHRCGDVGTLLCDFPVGNGKTCDKPICESHATEIGPDTHYCPAHAQMWLEWKQSGGLNKELENVVSFKPQQDPT